MIQEHVNTWKEFKKGELLMSKFKNEFKNFMEDIEKNIKNKEDLEYVKGRTSEFLNVILDQMEGIVNFEEEKIALLEEQQQQINAKMQTIKPTILKYLVHPNFNPIINPIITASIIILVLHFFPIH